MRLLIQGEKEGGDTKQNIHKRMYQMLTKIKILYLTNGRISHYLDMLDYIYVKSYLIHFRIVCFKEI